MTTPQSYLLPTPDGGWALISYGFSDMDDDQIRPLPITTAIPYLDACSFVHNLPFDWHLIDGWETDEQLLECEPELHARAWDLYGKFVGQR